MKPRSLLGPLLGTGAEAGLHVVEAIEIRIRDLVARPERLLLGTSRSLAPAGLQSVHVDTLLILALPVQDVELGPLSRPGARQAA